MSFRIAIAASSPLRPAWMHVLHTVLRVAEERVSISDKFHVTGGTEDSETYHGVLPILSVLRANVQEEGMIAFLGGEGVAQKALVNQWVILASQIAQRTVAADEAETAMAGASQEFLTGSASATIADVLMYSAIPDDALARLPTLLKWSRFAVTDPNVAPLARTAAAAAPSAAGVAATEATQSATGQASRSGFDKPSAEEIERRRIEKEKAKAEKEKAKLSSAAAGEQGAAPAARPVSPTKKQTPSSSSSYSANDIDVRVGRIATIARHPEADKLFMETIDLGSETRTIVSGLVEHYSAEQLLGAYVLVVCNLKPKPLKGVASHGMVLCASTAASAGVPAALRIVSPPEGTPAGQRVTFGGQLSARLPEVPSNAGTVELLSHLKTDSHGVVMWKDQPAAVPLGNITSELKDAVVK